MLLVCSFAHMRIKHQVFKQSEKVEILYKRENVFLLSREMKNIEAKSWALEREKESACARILNILNLFLIKYY